MMTLCLPPNLQGFKRLGEPQAAVPFERGIHQRRSHPAPVNRDLADGRAGSPPAVLAMTPADGRGRLGDG